MCRGPYLRRVSRAGAFERLLSVAFVYPFRCQLCGWRFRSMRFGVRYEKKAVDRRQFVRVPVHIPARLRANLASENGVITDLSLGGCAIETTADAPVGRVLQLGMKMSPDDETLVVDAAVVRSAHMPNINLEFLKMPEDSRKKLRRFMEDHFCIPGRDRDAAAFTTAPSAPRPGG
jgi:hypothetical protein